MPSETLSLFFYPSSRTVWDRVKSSMTEEETTTLNSLLIKFFSESKFGSANYLTRNSTASLLKKSLLNIGHWRNKARNKFPKRKPLPPKIVEEVVNNCPF